MVFKLEREPLTWNVDYNSQFNQPIVLSLNPSWDSGQVGGTQEIERNGRVLLQLQWVEQNRKLYGISSFTTLVLIPNGVCRITLAASPVDRQT